MALPSDQARQGSMLEGARSHYRLRPGIDRPPCRGKSVKTEGSPLNKYLYGMLLDSEKSIPYPLW